LKALNFTSLISTVIECDTSRIESLKKNLKDTQEELAKNAEKVEKNPKEQRQFVSSVTAALKNLNLDEVDESLLNDFIEEVDGNSPKSKKDKKPKKSEETLAYKNPILKMLLSRESPAAPLLVLGAISAVGVLLNPRKNDA